MLTLVLGLRGKAHLKRPATSGGVKEPEERWVKEVPEERRVKEVLEKS